jgi:hypothetical protein
LINNLKKGFKMAADDYIRKPNQVVPLTKEQLLEFARIMKRPNGIKRFVNYVEINTSDGPKNFGKVIKPFQYDMIDLMQNNDRAILLASRQMSKCVTKDAKITVRNDKTGEEMELTIEEFHNLMKGMQ